MANPFFGFDTEPLPSGLMLNLELLDVNDPKRVLLEISLEAHTGSQDPVTLRPPEDYSQVRVEERRLDLPKGDRISPNPNEARRLRAAATHQKMQDDHRLRSRGQDFAWIMRQEFLNRGRHLINSLSRTLGRFHSGRRTSAIQVDWWRHVERHLHFRDNDEAVRGLKLLILYKRIADRQPLPADADGPGGLSPTEQSEYDSLIRLAEADPIVAVIGAGASRVTRFINEFPGMIRPALRPGRRAALAELVWSQLTEPIALTLPGRTHVDLAIWTLDLSDLRYTLNIDHQDIIRRLAFQRSPIIRLRSGRLSADSSIVRVELALTSVDGTFDFLIAPKATLGSFLCGLFTFGLCHILVGNAGSGSFNLNDIKLAFDIVPRIDGSSIFFDALFNREDSELDANVWTVGANPFATIVEVVVLAISNFFDFFQWPAMDEIQRSLEAVLNAPLFKWPQIWHALNGPDNRATAALVQADSGILEADALSRDLTGGATAAPVDPDRVSIAGYVFSPQYLTAWLRKLTGPIPARSDYSAIDFAARFGIVLPDPASLDDPTPPAPEDRIHESIIRAFERICGEPPAPLAPFSSFTFWLQRFGPSVQLPPSSDLAVTKVGTVIQRFVYRLQVFRRSFKFEPVGNIFGGLPGMGRSGGFSCDWEATETRTLLATYLVGSVEVTSDLLVGFNEQGDWWLPEIALGARLDDGMIQFTPRLVRLDTDREFDGIARDTLRDALFADAIDQARTILSALAQPIAANRHLIAPDDVLAASQFLF